MRLAENLPIRSRPVGRATGGQAYRDLRGRNMRVTIQDIGLAIVRLIDRRGEHAADLPMPVEELRQSWSSVGLRDGDLDRGLHALLAREWLRSQTEQGCDCIVLTARGRAQLFAQPRTLQGWIERLRSRWVLAMAARRVPSRRLRPLVPLG